MRSSCRLDGEQAAHLVASVFLWWGCPHGEAVPVCHPCSGVGPIPFSPSSVEPAPQFPLRARQFWRIQDGASSRRGSGGGCRRWQGDSSVTAALLSGLLVPWPCCRFWLEAGEFGACLRAGQFCKQWDVLSMGRWKLTRLSALKRMINKD